MPISPEADYCLMGSVSCLDMTPDIDEGARLMRLDVDGILDDLSRRYDRRAERRRGNPDPFYRGSDSFADVVTSRVLHWREHQASMTERRLMAWAGLVHAEDQICDAVLGATNDLIRNVSGAIRNPEPTEELLSRVLEPTAVDVAFQDDHRSRWMVLFRDQYHRIVEILRGTEPDRLFDEIAEHRRRRTEEWNNLHRVSVVERQCIIPRKTIKKARKAVLKGVEQYGRLFGKEGIRTFLKGDTLVVHGVLYDYHVKRSYSVVTHSIDAGGGHIPYDLAIHSKDGDYLAKGCVYFEDTPVIDQIIALTLHVREREAELEVIKTANWSRVEDQEFDDVVSTLRPPIVLDARENGTPLVIPAPGVMDEETWSFVSSAKDLRDALMPRVATILEHRIGIPRDVFRFMSTRRSLHAPIGAKEVAESILAIAA